MRRANRSTFGGGGGGFSLSFPPFTPMVKLLIIINVAVYFLVLFGNIAAPGFRDLMDGIFGFTPLAAVNHGRFWQFVTYGFLHAGIWHIVINMLTLWMFGSALESTWRGRQFAEFYFFCLIGAALTMLTTGWVGYAMAHGGSGSSFWNSLATLLMIPTVGASGAIYGVLVAFGMLFGDQEIMMFPIPIQIKAKYLVTILVLIVFASSLQPQAGGVANFAHLGGALFGFLYVRYVPRRGLLFGASESYFGWRNNYYRWKRRRAARKFEVYMSKHDRKEFFDEYGNYRPPEDEPGNGETRPPWVN